MTEELLYQETCRAGEGTPEISFVEAVVYALPPAKKVLALAPHPDDEIFGCGGALTTLAAAGVDVTVVVVSDGAHVEDASGDITARRQQESCRAAALLGLRAPIFLGLADRSLEPNEDLIQLMLAQLDQYQPDLLFLPAHTEAHPDHYALAVAGTAALQRSGRNGHLVYYEIGVGLPAPTTLLDISAVESDKQQAMSCFASQLTQQRYDEQIAGLNRHRAYFLGPTVQSAEAFVVLPVEKLTADTPANFRLPLLYWQLTSVKNKRLQELEQVIADWEQWIVGLKQEITNLSAERDSLSLVVSEWESWIAGLQRENEVSLAINQERERWLRTLEPNVEQYRLLRLPAEGKTDVLKQYISDDLSYLNVLLNSRSWKLLMFLKKIYRFLCRRN